MSGVGEVVNNVLFGKDDWLFLWQGGQRQFDFLTGKRDPVGNSIENFVSNLLARNKFCADRSIAYAHVTFPSKPVVMVEFLPDAIADQVVSLFDRHYAEPLKISGNNNIFYARDALLASKKVDQVFCKHDTHMTAFGNIVVARGILQALGHVHDPIDHMEMSECSRPGDLSNMADLRIRMSEKHFAVADDSFKFFDNRPFLPGNIDNIVISLNRKAESDRRLLALGDSFLKDCIPALSTFYQDILYVRSDVFQPELIDLFGPTEIITSNAERYLSSVANDITASSVFMTGYGRENYTPSEEFVNALTAQLSFRAYPHKYSEWAASISEIDENKLPQSVNN